MSWDKPAPTLTTKCNSYSNGRFGHPDITQHRAISIREASRLQTFPADYIFKGAFNSMAKQIGNAVPCELARQFGLHFIKHHDFSKERIAMANFKTRARTLDLLGRQQIAGIPTAINELLKMPMMPMLITLILIIFVRIIFLLSEMMVSVCQELILKIDGSPLEQNQRFRT